MDSEAINKVASTNKTVYARAENFAGGRMSNVRSAGCTNVNMQMCNKNFSLTEWRG